MTRNQIRSNETRETETREEEWTFEEPNALDIPDAVKARFDNEGMALRWIRVSLQGKDDITNVGKKMQSGWVFVTPDEVPEMALTSFVRDEGRYHSVLCSSSSNTLRRRNNNSSYSSSFFYNQSHFS